MVDADGPGGASVSGWDFFVSYTRADQDWAEWIAWELEAAGYRVLFQAWDFVPGTHWTSGMQEGIVRADRTLAILSGGYLDSVYGQQEWNAAYRADPSGFTRKLVPVRVQDCGRPGLLGTIVGFDLFDCGAAIARDRLLDGVAAAVAGRAKPVSAPGFPARGEVAVPTGTSPGRRDDGARPAATLVRSGHGEAQVPSPTASPAFPGVSRSGADDPPRRTVRRPVTLTAVPRSVPSLRDSATLVAAIFVVIAVVLSVVIYLVLAGSDSGHTAGAPAASPSSEASGPPRPSAAATSPSPASSPSMARPESTQPSGTSQHAYSSAVRNTFLTSCQAGNSRDEAYCQCALAIFESHYTEAELADMDADPHSLRTTLITGVVAASCLYLKDGL